MKNRRINIMIAHTVPDKFDPSYDTFYTKINKKAQYIRLVFGAKTRIKMKLRDTGDADPTMITVIEALIFYDENNPDIASIKNTVNNIINYSRATEPYSEHTAIVGEVEIMKEL